MPERFSTLILCTLSLSGRYHTPRLFHHRDTEDTEIGAAYHGMTVEEAFDNQECGRIGTALTEGANVFRALRS